MKNKSFSHESKPLSRERNLSVVISVFNGEEKLEECLKSVKTIADEIIVVDNSSTDKSASIARKYKARVFTRPNNPMLNINKNFGFSKASGEWILKLDHDESLTPELAREIEEKIGNSNVVGYWIPRKNIIFGKWIQNSIWWPDYQLRLFKKGKGKFPEIHVHEYIQVDGETEKLEESFIHENYSTVSQYLQKMDKIYTTNEAQRIIETGKKLTWIDAIRLPLHDFLKTFFLQKGYKDGLHGLVLSLFQSFYAVVVFAKVWEKQGFVEENDPEFLKKVEKELKRASHEFQYWVLHEKEETSSFPQKFILKALKKREQKKSQEK